MTRFNPLDHATCLAFPARVANSAWLQHVPFGMWIVSAARPRVLVELGAFAGVSYCGFCQAVKHLELGTHCYAVDTWQGDAHAGYYGGELLAELRAHHDPLYGSFSRLVQSTFDMALEHFGDGTIDLLHIDGFHSYEAVRRDFESWLPKLSDRAIVLFHDTNVREHDFGVWQLWKELIDEYPGFEMLHGHGLGILAVGTHQPDAIRALVDASNEEADLIREFFYQMGIRVDSAQQINVSLAWKREQTERLLDLERRWPARLQQVWENGGATGVVRKSMSKLGLASRR